MDSITKKHWILCALTLLMCGVTVWLRRPVKLDDPPLDMDCVPMDLLSWKGEDVGALEEEVSVLPKDVTIYRRIYTKEDTQLRVELAVITTGHKTKASLHDPKVCLQAQGWEPVDRQIVSLHIPGFRNNPLEVVKLVTRREREGSVAYYWFQSDLRVCTERLASFWSNAKRKLFEGKRERWALVRLICVQEEGSETAAMELVELLGPYLLGRWVQ